MDANSKAALIRALRDLGHLLGFDAEASFRSKACLRAAQNLELVEDDIDHLLASGELQRIPSLGPSITAWVAEFASTGHIRALDELYARFGRAAAEVALRTGLTADKLRLLHETIGLGSKEALLVAAKHGRVKDVPGFGPKSEAALVAQLAGSANSRAVLHRHEAQALYERVAERCRTYGIGVLPAGSLRRGAELPERVEVVVDDRYRDAIAQALRSAGAVSVEPETNERLSARMSDGAVVAVTLAPTNRLGVAQAFATATPEHRLALEERAAARGLDLTRLVAATEVEVYAALGLAYLAPELRWRAPTHAPPRLVDRDDVRGLVHCHTTWSDGEASIADMARAAEARGATYLTITDHSYRVPPDRLRRQWDAIDRAQGDTPVRLLKGLEVDVAVDGALDYPEKLLERLDVIIASMHQRHALDRRAMTERIVRAIRHPLFKIWGHPLGRLLPSRPPIDVDFDAVLAAAEGARVAFEISGDPFRLDLPVEQIERAKAHNVRFVVSSDAHAPDDLGYCDHALTLARRAGLTSGDILNTRDEDAFRALVAPRPPRATSGRSPFLRLA